MSTTIDRDDLIDEVMPDAAPVTNAVFPSSDFIAILPDVFCILRRGVRPCNRALVLPQGQL